MQSDKEHTKFDLYLKLAGLLIGPVATLALLLIFWKPIKILSSELPEMVKRTETITIAGITVKTSDQIAQKPTAKINEALTGLNHDSLLELLELGVDNPSLGAIIRYDTKSYNNKVKSLTDRGLVKVVEPLPLDTTVDKRLVSVRQTKLGVKSSLVLADLFNAFVQEISKSNKSINNDEDE